MRAIKKMHSHTLPKSAIGRACCGVLTLILSACSTLGSHIAVPSVLSSPAVVDGFPENIRFWADEPPAFADSIITERINAYRAAHADYYRAHGTYPPLNYLAISGGANDGAFGAGLLSGWSASGTRPDFELVTGVSAGALIAPFVFIGPRYDGELQSLFTTTSSDGIAESNLLGVLSALTGGLSITNSRPLADKISKTVTPEVMAEVAAQHRKGKRLFIATTNLEAQRGVIWDIGAIASSGNPNALKLIHQIILASASVPGFFQPVFIDVQAGGKHYTEIHVDGGVVSQLFIYPIRIPRSVVDQFLRNHLERHLYVIRNGKAVPEYQSLKPNFFALSRRSIETLTKYDGLGDLYRLYLMSKRDGIDYHVIYIPESFSEESRELFDPAYMRKLFDAGEAIGKRAVIPWAESPPGLDYQAATPTH
jgi:hypothetical protein